MKSIDKEIYEVEQRLHEREARIERTLDELKLRSARAARSPAAIGGAVALGAVIVGLGARRAARKPAVPDRRRRQSGPSKIGALAMAGVSWLIRSQFGGPAGLAQFVLSKVKSSKPPEVGRRATPVVR
jgi:hypothetical protein